MNRKTKPLKNESPAKGMGWTARAKALLRAELVRRDVSFEDLSLRLEMMGVDESKGAIAQKIRRGTFSAVFLLQALTAIGCKRLEIDPD